MIGISNTIVTSHHAVKALSNCVLQFATEIEMCPSFKVNTFCYLSPWL